MSDINQFIISGTVSSVSFDNKGWAIIKVNSTRKTKDKEGINILSVVIWGEKAGDLAAGDEIIIQGYLSGKELTKRDGEKFIAESKMASYIKKIGNNQDKKEHQIALDSEEIPF